MGSTRNICYATAFVCFLTTSPEWSNRFQDQELLRSAPVRLLIGEMGENFPGVRFRGSADPCSVA